MIAVRPAGERGVTRLGWLDSRHSFSFNRYYDPRRMGFRGLRVINEDFIAPGGKFGRHPHDNMEILTWVLRGAVEHQDSTGARGLIRPGEVQRMSAGRGIFHSEANASATEELHLYQVWIEPGLRDLEPEYEQKAFDEGSRRNRLRLIASPAGRDGSVTIQTDAEVYNGLLDAGTAVEYRPAAGRGIWIQAARGAVKVNGIALHAGDAAAVESEESLRIEAAGDSEVILFDLA
jgi:redox-sensitive bicupin YhaK (pirin superfamily)